MDQLICASLSHTHYWYEVGILKVPAVCHCMFRAGRVDVDEGLDQVRRGCMFSAAWSVFALCILVPFRGSGN